jgi:HK97 family phage prohead protease
MEWFKDKDYIKSIENGERRTLPAKIEFKDDSGTVEGIASVVEKKYDMLFYDEVIAKGAFDDALTGDIRVLFNHDMNLVLGRSKSGTASIFIDADGNLAYRYKTPNRSYAKDLEDMVKSGDVSQSSFAFTVKEEKWNWAKVKGERDMRVITKIDTLYDVSPVTYPANPETTVTIARGVMDKHYQELKNEHEAEMLKIKINEVQKRELLNKINQILK